MIRIGFLLNYPTTYKGALNYFHNLFYAINKHLGGKVEVTLFVPADIAEEYITLYSSYVKIVKTKVLIRKNPLWLADKICEKLFNVNPLLDNLLLRHQIDIVSHSSFISKKLKTINWIMDFQHNHYPNLWTEDELKATKKFLDRLIVQSNGLFLSSYSAFDDFKDEYSNLIDKVNVLHFVCQPKGQLKISLSEEERKALTGKYDINRSFFYLPNQFWSHKNHEVAFKAVKILKDKGLNPLLITSGLMNDFRSKSDHLQKLKDYIIDNQLESNILLLGLIPYEDVLNLITLSDCIINPSFFEGWSSTVEESKTMGKRLILSDLKVHREQAPEYGIYFDPNNAEQLAEIMTKVINKELSSGNSDLKDLNNNLNLWTKQFAEDYLKGIRKVLNTKI